ncbi:MAG: hypothetical protein CHACPFDD_01566 [Phycisphaerae bacterium]|nr:hypothetical protein [Phycisphaerae bacterium]
MMPDEKVKLLELLDQNGRWCQHAEAQDAGGDPVHCDDASAAAWDVTGALYCLFGAKRAGVLCVQLDRHIHGKRRDFGWPQQDPELVAMVALQSFNDRPETTFEVIRSWLESLPVWSGKRH